MSIKEVCIVVGTLLGKLVKSLRNFSTKKVNTNGNEPLKLDLIPTNGIVIPSPTAKLESQQIKVEQSAKIEEPVIPEIKEIKSEEKPKVVEIRDPAPVVKPSNPKPKVENDWTLLFNDNKNNTKK